jgi:hypothetical protein
MQRLLGLPYAYHTIGSAMTVRASAYLAHFGMNKRQAGEDFYFLHKFIKTGYFREINTTTVYPSSRFSDRVPFGTGQSVRKLAEGEPQMTTYNPLSYLGLRSFMDHLDKLYVTDDPRAIPLEKTLLTFLGDQWPAKLTELKKNTSDFVSFKKRFFQWFDAFMLIKYLHFMRDRQYPNVTIDQAIGSLFKLLDWKDTGNAILRLQRLRQADKNK